MNNKLTTHDYVDSKLIKMYDYSFAIDIGSGQYDVIKSDDAQFIRTITAYDGYRVKIIFANPFPITAVAIVNTGTSADYAITWTGRTEINLYFSYFNGSTITKVLPNVIFLKIIE